MADINDVLQIARVFKSQAEADLMNDTYSKVLPTNMISFCDAVNEVLKEKQPKKGHWIDIDSQLYTWKVRCSECGCERSMMSTQGKYPRFCEGCGADMRGEQDEKGNN